MSGHSRWATIRRKKAAADAKRGKAFTQLIRELSMAARLGGADVDANPRLRLAIEHARAANMPKDNIERAVKKGAGQLEGESVAEVRYEGYGPGGAAVMVDTLTDNRNRTVGEVRHLFTRFGGNLGASGCVAYLFEKRGLLQFDVPGATDALLEAAIDADPLDVAESAGSVEVQTRPESFESVRRALEARGFRPARAELSMFPLSTVKLVGRDAQSMLRLYEALDEHDDVRHVFANFDISEEEMEAVAQGR